MSTTVRQRQLVPDGVRKQVFSWVVKKHRGCCELSKITKELLPWLKRKEDLLSILKEAPWHQQCITLMNSIDGKDSLAIAFCPKIRLCFTYYREGTCGRGSDCQYIHLCHSKLYYDHCRCTETDDCMASEQVLPHIKELQGLSEDEKGIVLRNSLPTVCLGYNSSQGCLNISQYAMCPYVHVCIHHIHGMCKDPTCPWAHTLKEAAHHRQLQYWNEHIESNHRLEMRLISNLLIPPVTGPLLKFLIQQGIRGASLDETNRNAGIKGLGIDIVISTGEPQITVYTHPLEKTSYAAISAAEFLICSAYNSPKGCNDDGCLEFHVCGRFILGSCTSSEACSFSHDLDDMFNAASFKNKKCSHLGLAERHRVIEISMLRLCPNKQCTELLCGYIHICEDYLSTGVCCRLSCAKGHSFTSEHNANTLLMHDMLEWEAAQLKRRIACHNLWTNEEAAPAALSPKAQKNVQKLGVELSSLLTVFNQMQISKEIDENENVKVEEDEYDDVTPLRDDDSVNERGDPPQVIKKETSKQVVTPRIEGEVQAVVESQPVEADFCWKYLDSSGAHKVFGLEEGDLQQDLIEARYKEFLDKKSFGIVNYEENGSHFELNFNFMFQVHLKNLSIRPIVREGTHGDPSLYRVSYRSTDLPEVIPRWSPMDTRRPFEADIVALLQSTEECQNVAKEFFRSINQSEFRIHRIYRVQNLNLYKRYMLMKTEMKQQSTEEDPCELSLFHGTPDIDTVRCICNQSFDWRLSGQYGSKYGDGAYFATRSFFSSHYTRPSLVNSRRYIFQAKVLVGKHTQGFSGMKRPPPLGVKKHGLLYNSVADNETSPQTYVIFNSDQAYPTYLIEYADIPAGFAD